MRKLHQSGRRRWGGATATAAAATAVLVSSLAMVGAAAPGAYAAGAGAVRTSAVHAARHHHANSCRLGNGVKHVIEIGFDNVHFYRDNPNVPSDLEMMPNLLNFITGHGQHRLPALPPGRPDPLGSLVRLLARPDLRHGRAPERRPRHEPGAGLLAHAACHHLSRDDAEYDHPRALGAVHPGRL